MDAMTSQLENFLQRAGRAGRDDNDCAVVLFCKRKGGDLSNPSNTYRTNPGKKCLRTLMSSYFAGNVESYSGNIGCCSICGIEGDTFLAALEEVTINDQNKRDILFGPDDRRRPKVCQADRAELRTSLEEERIWYSHNFQKNMSLGPTHLTDGVINSIVEHVSWLFTLSDVKKIVSDSYTAGRVIEFIADIFKDTKTQFDMDVNSD